MDKIAIGLALGYIMLLVAIRLVSRRPVTLGVTGGKLAGCPAKPNCVSTQASAGLHKIEPFRFTGPAAAAMSAIKAALARHPNAHVVTETADYLHVEFTTRLLRYVDDVEFHIDEANRVVHFRSASRVGYSDWGVNRKRMESLRAHFDLASALTGK